MHIDSYVSHPGKEVNEDLLIMSPKCSGILDGSSGLGGMEFGAKAFIEYFSEQLISGIDSGKGLVEAVNQAIEKIKERYSTIDGVIPPSASLMIAYETDTDIQVLSIGDCYCYLFFKNGEYELLYKDEVAPYDQSVIDRMIEIRKDTDQNIGDLINTEEIQAFLIRNRKKLNSPEGYRILAPNMDFVSEKEVISWPKSDISRLVMFSDGFSLIKEEFVSMNLDLDSLYQELREKENSDHDLNSFPRLKISDDASALIISI